MASFVAGQSVTETVFPEHHPVLFPFVAFKHV
jgi:hypothetical protein